MLEESRKIVHWLTDEISGDTYINIMGQYRIAPKVGTVAHTDSGAGAPRYVEINRPPDFA